MTHRLLATLKLDITVQWRNRFYYIGVGLALLIAFLLSQLVTDGNYGQTIPIFFLLAVGGSTMLYVGGLIIFEKDEHTLDSVIVSPLRLHEYIISKVSTLSLLASIESIIVVLLLQRVSGYNPILLLIGIFALGAMLVLVGLVMIVRFRSITDFLMPVLVVGLIVQLPIIYFTGLSTSFVWLIVPTAAPTMLLWGAWNELESWQLIYGLLYSLVTIFALYRWSMIAFRRHIIMGNRS